MRRIILHMLSMILRMCLRMISIRVVASVVHCSRSALLLRLLTSISIIRLCLRMHSIPHVLRSIIIQLNANLVLLLLRHQRTLQTPLVIAFAPRRRHHHKLSLSLRLIMIPFLLLQLMLMLPILRMIPLPNPLPLPLLIPLPLLLPLPLLRSLPRPLPRPSPLRMVCVLCCGSGFFVCVVSSYSACLPSPCVSASYSVAWY